MKFFAYYLILRVGQAIKTKQNETKQSKTKPKQKNRPNS